MASVNKVILLGNLGAEPEVRQTQSGRTVTTFRIATTERWTGKDGERNDKTEWHKIVAWGRLAEICEEYLQKGSSVYVEGKLTTRTWDDSDGTRRYSTEIIAQNIQMLGSKTKPAKEESLETDKAQPVIPDDDIPF